MALQGMQRRSVRCMAASSAHTTGAIRFRPCIDIHKVGACVSLAGRARWQPLQWIHTPLRAICRAKSSRLWAPRSRTCRSMALGACALQSDGSGTVTSCQSCHASPNAHLALARSGDAALQTNFVSDKPSSWYSELYRGDGLTGGHVIMLGADSASKCVCCVCACGGGVQRS
jgi:hypothetical protein